MSWADPSNRGPRRCTLAIDATGAAFGYVVRYPSGALIHGEQRDDMDFLNAVDSLLQNQLPWRVLLTADGDERISGALWYLAAKHGADFTERPLPHLTDGQLTKAGLWRRGFSAANRAARLLYEGPA